MNPVNTYKGLVNGQSTVDGLLEGIRDRTGKAETRMSQIFHAYERMVSEAKYRPAAPGDGFGGIFLDPDQLADETTLQKEAHEYAHDSYARKTLVIFGSAAPASKPFAPSSTQSRRQSVCVQELTSNLWPPSC